MVNSQYKKITQVLRYLVSQAENNRINILLLIKLVWAADRYHARKYASLVTDYDYRALPKGPVSSKAYDIADASSFLSAEQIAYSERYVARSGNDIVGIASAEMDYLSETDQEALDFAWQTFGHMNQFDVVNITHQYPEWKKFEADFTNGASAEDIDLTDFFANPVENDYFAVDDEFLAATKAKFEENFELHKLIRG